MQNEGAHKQTAKAATVVELTASQYKAMYATDEVFKRELVRVYGKSNAGDARYRLQHEDEAVQKARDAFVAACNAYHEALRDARQVYACDCPHCAD